MASIFFIMSMICLFGVAVSLFLGLFAMANGAEKSRKTSNKMMRVRVALQGLTVLFLLLSYVAR